MVLAYSGGLDTSIILKWLKDTYNCEVRCESHRAVYATLTRVPWARSAGQHLHR